jgi:hypothetical protein
VKDVRSDHFGRPATSFEDAVSATLLALDFAPAGRMFDIVDD